MVVICGNAECGALLRSAQKTSPLHAVIRRDASGPYFICPRCQNRTVVPERRRAPRAEAGPPIQSNDR